MIEVVSILVGGRVIPINVLGMLVPAQNKQEDIAAQYNGSQTTRLNALATSLVNSRILSNDGDKPNVYDALDLGLNLAIGLTQPVTKLPPPLVNIPQGSVFILTLAAPLTVQKRLVETGIQIQQQAGPEGSGIPSVQ